MDSTPRTVHQEINLLEMREIHFVETPLQCRYAETERRHMQDVYRRYMSKFEVTGMPGGEIVIGRTLTREKDGVDDHTEFMMRHHEQNQLIKWLWKNRPYQMEDGQ